MSFVANSGYGCGRLVHKIQDVDHRGETIIVRNTHTVALSHIRLSDAGFWLDCNADMK